MKYSFTRALHQVTHSNLPLPFWLTVILAPPPSHESVCFYCKDKNLFSNQYQLYLIRHASVHSAISNHLVATNLQKKEYLFLL